MNPYQKRLMAPISKQEALALTQYGKLCGVMAGSGKEFRLILSGWRMAFIAMAELQKARDSQVKGIDGGVKKIDLKGGSNEAP